MIIAKFEAFRFERENLQNQQEDTCVGVFSNKAPGHEEHLRTTASKLEIIVKLFDLLGLLESIELRFSQDLTIVDHLKNGLS